MNDFTTKISWCSCSIDQYHNQLGVKKPPTNKHTSSTMQQKTNSRFLITFRALSLSWAWSVCITTSLFAAWLPQNISKTKRKKGEGKGTIPIVALQLVKIRSQLLLLLRSFSLSGKKKTVARERLEVLKERKRKKDVFSPLCLWDKAGREHVCTIL